MNGLFLVVILCVPFNELSTWMLGAYTAGITSGDYVFIHVNAQVPSQTEYKHFLYPSSWITTSEVQKAAMSLLMVRHNVQQVLDLLIIKTVRATLNWCGTDGNFKTTLEPHYNTGFGVHSIISVINRIVL